MSLTMLHIGLDHTQRLGVKHKYTNRNVNNKGQGDETEIRWWEEKREGEKLWERMRITGNHGYIVSLEANVSIGVC